MEKLTTILTISQFLLYKKKKKKLASGGHNENVEKQHMFTD